MNAAMGSTVHFVADDLAPACDARLAREAFSGTGNETDVTCEKCMGQLANPHRGNVKRGREFSR